MASSNHYALKVEQQYARIDSSKTTSTVSPVLPPPQMFRRDSNRRPKLLKKQQSEIEKCHAPLPIDDENALWCLILIE
jgi:hypothetical protein